MKQQDLQKIASDEKMPLPQYSPTLGRWLFLRPQPKATARTPKPLKIGRWILLGLVAGACFLIMKGAR